MSTLLQGQEKLTTFIAVPFSCC